MNRKGTDGVAPGGLKLQCIRNCQLSVILCGNEVNKCRSYQFVTYENVYSKAESAGGEST